MVYRLLTCLIIIAWLLCLPLSSSIAAENTLAAICGDYRSTETLAPPAADDIPDLRHGRGILWQVESADGSTSHLFGSLHSQDRRVTAGMPPQVRLALVRSQHMLIEVVPDAGSNQAFLDAMFADNGVSVASSLDPQLFDEFVRIAMDYHVPEAHIADLKPWAAFSLIGRPRPVNAPTQEMVIYQEAEQRNIPVTGLESMQELVATLESLSTADQLEILTDTICNHDRIVAGNRILLDLYMDRHLAGMVAYNAGNRHDDAVFERFMEAILYQRNERMLERMLPYLERGGAFVVVGALHLPAEGGLLELLELEGYSVTPVY